MLLRTVAKRAIPRLRVDLLSGGSCWSAELTGYGSSQAGTGSQRTTTSGLADPGYVIYLGALQLATIVNVN